MSFIRAAKYYTKGYSEIQTKVRDATSNADQPPTGRMLNEISQLSFDPECLKAILEILDKRLNDKGKNWRHVYKSLLVLDYLLHSGSEAIVMYFQTNAYLIKTLTDFQYVDEESNKDHGASVRSRAKDIANLLSDEARLRQTRRNRAEMRDRMMGKKPRTEKEEEEYENENVQRRSQVISMASAGSERSPTSPKFSHPMSTGNSDDSRLSAIAAIKAVRATEDRHLMNAFKFSHAADEKKVEEQKKEDNVRSFDDIFASEPEDQSSAKPSQAVPAAPVQPATAPAAPSSNAFPLIVLDDQAANNASQAPQVLLTPTMSTFNPFYQQTQLEMQQAEFQRQQQEWQQVQAAHEAQMQAQQQEMQQAQAQMQAQQQMMAQQMAQQAFFQQQQQQMPPASAQVNNPWMQSQQQPMVASPWGLESTQQAPSPASAGLGSKNPFLSASSSAASVPSLYTSFSSSSSSLASPPFPPTPSTPSFPPPSPTSNAASKESKFKVDTDQFESIFASRSDGGMDTFGNVGNLRMGPNQHQHLLL